MMKMTDTWETLKSVQGRTVAQRSLSPVGGTGGLFLVDFSEGKDSGGIFFFIKTLDNCWFSVSIYLLIFSE